jgi:hypothetical protein
MFGNKKGLSEVVTYVLLIVIAMGLSAVVFAFLSNIVPEEKYECPEGLALTITEVDCESPIVNKQVYITFQNKGRFEIDGIYSRVAENKNDAPSIPLVPIADSTSVSDGGSGGINLITQDEASKGFLYFGRGSPSELRPNQEYKQLFSYEFKDPPNNEIPLGSIEKIEIQPFVNVEDGRELGICEDKVITRSVSCN